MLLLQIKDYIETNREVSLSHLSKRFDISESAMQDMVYQWIKKGKVAIVEKNTVCPSMESSNQSSCSSQCGGCCAQSIKSVNTPDVWYQWL